VTSSSECGEEKEIMAKIKGYIVVTCEGTRSEVYRTKKVAEQFATAPHGIAIAGILRIYANGKETYC
jgi:hypothetical protein